MLKMEATIENLIDLSVRKAIKSYAKELKVEQNKMALHNTRLLLKNYDKIKKSIELSIDELNQDILELDIDFSDVTDIDGERLYIDSIRRSKARSLTIISHIDNALQIMRQEKEKTGFKDKYDIFYNCIFNKMSYEDAAQEYNTSIASVSRWIKELTREMSVYIFGVDGINNL